MFLCCNNVLWRQLLESLPPSAWDGQEWMHTKLFSDRMLNTVGKSDKCIDEKNNSVTEILSPFLYIFLSVGVAGTHYDKSD